MRDIEKFVEGLHDYIGKALRPIADQVRSLTERVEELAARAPEKGDPGESIKGDPGEPGRDGRDGRDAPAEDEIRAWVAEAVAAIPAPKDGLDGKDGQDGKTITIEDVRGLLESEQAKWALEFERRAQDTLQRAIDRIPAPEDGKDGLDGANGVDGLGFDDLTIEHDGERKFTFVLQRGDQVKRMDFVVPVVIDRGFYQRGMSVAAGDGVTSGGSYWIAKKDTDSEPAVGNDDWRLAVRKGRDARGGVPTPRDPAKPVRISEPGA